MRLRYLHIPRCGPLNDVSVIFGREDLITNTLNLPRKGALNFVVGVNGSGKSTLLRVLYHVFRALNRREWPTLPVTLSWDRTLGVEAVTALLHSTNRKDALSFFATCKPVPISARRPDWERIIATMSKGEHHPLAEGLEMITGPDAITSPLLFSRLPKRLIAYTSGDCYPWMQIDHPIFHPLDEEEGQYSSEDERPHGWDMDKEWEEAQHILISNALTRNTTSTTTTSTTTTTTSTTTTPPPTGVTRPTIPGSALKGMIRESLELLQREPGQVEDIFKKLLANHMTLKGPQDDSYFLIEPHHLRFAGITLALWQAARELSGCTSESSRESLRNYLLGRYDSKDRTLTDARPVFEQIDWFWPTHLSFTYHDDDRVTPRQHLELFCLIALADEVLDQPFGRRRAVFSLGPFEKISLTERLKDAFPLGITSKDIEFIAERVDGSRTGAEAFLRVLSSDQEIDSTPMDVFTRLKDWERTGLLEDITLTMKRLHQHESFDGESDDIIITYDQLSDGEQMLLGRMGLFYLLRGQDGSLLLFDEPETHFNDVWKQKIVEMVDLGLLENTHANVIISTHTSIALTDAFAAEVTVLDKTDDGIIARGVTGGLFGTDPGEVTMNLFGSESSIGSRSVELLDKLMKTEWKYRESELEAILTILGSSFHRAELRAILKQLRANNDGTTSS